MADQFEEVGVVLRWNRRFLTIGGVWPLESTYIRSWIWIIYLTIHLSMQYAALYANLGILELMVNNVVETVFQTMVLAKLIVIRRSKTLRSLIVAVEQDFDVTNYDSLEERKIYMKYNELAKLFFKITIPTITAGSTLYYLVPMEHFIRTMHRNDTSPFVLPFRTRLFFTLSDTRTYLMVYAYQSPMIYVLVCHSAWFCLLTTMVLHICGQLAVLQHRIKNIKVSSDNDNDDSNLIFGKLAERHLRSIWMARTMDDAFNLILLQDLVGSTLLLGLTSYLALVRTQTDILVFCIAVVASITMLLLLYAYCIVGECLIDESTKVHETYYQCRWYESSFNFRKCLLISMSTTQEPLHLSAGKAYVFCLSGFTDVDMESARELYVWNRRVLSIGGMWPLEKTFVKFYISYFYFIVHVIMAIGDFVSVFGDMTLMIANLSETSVQVMVGVKMIVLRHSAPLQKILRRVEAAAKIENYRNQEEKRLYLAYNTIGRTFFRTGNYLAIVTVFLYHFRPMEDIIKAVLRNETMPYVLPYRMRLWFNLSDTRTYVLVYLSQSPMFYFYYCHTMSVCFLCTLIVHVAGELSVLAHRIRHIKDPRNPADEFRDVVVKHYKIISTANSIDDIFNVVLMEELIISTMLIGLATYSVLSKSLMVSMFEFFFFVNYTLALVLLILVYCITGDYLIHESKNVHDAYYECQWYEMPSKYQRQLTICMARTQKPLQLTAGRFYVFSLSKFCSVLKTSTAYISMLRTIV